MTTADAWTADELDNVRTTLRNTRLDLQLRTHNHPLPSPECGDVVDQADWASQVEFDALTFERDRMLLEQTEHVLDLLDRGLYGHCELCSTSIDKERLLAHPQATLCLTCAHASS